MNKQCALFSLIPSRHAPLPIISNRPIGVFCLLSVSNIFTSGKTEGWNMLATGYFHTEFYRGTLVFYKFILLCIFN